MNAELGQAASTAANAQDWGAIATLGGFVTTWVITALTWAYSHGRMSGKFEAQKELNKNVTEALGKSLDDKTLTLTTMIEANKTAMTKMIMKISDDHTKSITEIKNLFVDADHNPRLLTVTQHDHDCNSKHLVIATQLGAIEQKIDSKVTSDNELFNRLRLIEKETTGISVALANSNACSINGNGCQKETDKNESYITGG